MTILNSMMRAVRIAVLLLVPVAFAQTEPENKPGEPAATEPTKPDATEATKPEENTAEPVAKVASELTDSERAAAEAELTMVQNTKTKKDKWDVCEETSHYAKPQDPNNATPAEQEAYKAQMACMGE